MVALNSGASWTFSSNSFRELAGSLVYVPPTAPLIATSFDSDADTDVLFVSSGAALTFLVNTGGPGSDPPLFEPVTLYLGPPLGPCTGGVVYSAQALDAGVLG